MPPTSRSNERRRVAATGDCSPAAAAPWRPESSFCKRRNETCFRARREAPTRPSCSTGVGVDGVAPVCSPSTLRRIGLQAWASVVVGTSPARSPTLVGGAGEPAAGMGVASTPRNGVGRARTVMPHGGIDERPRFRARSTGLRSALHLRQRTCRRLAASTGRRARSSLPKRLDGAPATDALCCLSSQSTRVHEPHSHALGWPATPLARWCRNRGIRDRLLAKPICEARLLARDLNRAASDDRPEGRCAVAGRCPCRSSSFPRRAGRDLEKRCARCAKSPPFGGEPRPTACCKDSGHSTVALGVSRTCGDTRDPATEAAAAGAATTHHPWSRDDCVVATAPMIPRKPTVRASPNGF